MQIKKVPIDSIIQDPTNARKHNPENLHYIAESLRRFGQQIPLVVSSDNVIIVGNGRHRAAKDILHWKEIDVVYTKLTHDECAAFGIADNQTALSSEWDFTLLTGKIKKLSQYDPDQQWEALGFPKAEIDNFIKLSVKQAEDALLAAEQAVNSIDKSEEKADNKISAGKPIKVTKDQREVIDQAIQKIREQENDPKLPEPVCIELICADFLSGK